MIRKSRLQKKLKYNKQRKACPKVYQWDGNTTTFLLIGLRKYQTNKLSTVQNIISNTVKTAKTEEDPRILGSPQSKSDYS